MLSNPRSPPPLVPHFTCSFSSFPVLLICRWLRIICEKIPRPFTSLALFRGFLCPLSLFVVGSCDPHFTRSFSWIPVPSLALFRGLFCPSLHSLLFVGFFAFSTSIICENLPFHCAHTRSSVTRSGQSFKSHFSTQCSAYKDCSSVLGEFWPFHYVKTEDTSVYWDYVSKTRGQRSPLSSKNMSLRPSLEVS